MINTWNEQQIELLRGINTNLSNLLELKKAKLISLILKLISLISLIKTPTEMSRKFKYCVLFTSIILHNYCIRRRLPYNILPHILNDRDESVRHYDENEKARVRFF